MRTVNTPPARNATIAPSGPAWDSHSPRPTTKPTPTIAPNPSVKSWFAPMTRRSWPAGGDASRIAGPQDRARQAGRTAGALLRDLASFVLDHGGPGFLQTPAGDGVAGDHQAPPRREGEDVARERPVLVVGHLD